ncbi:aminotransferase family protein [Pradoshia eiseniae]|uniref:aminotransferase family protein n=1 Tax=Pradoshia eiseniae TaxID=2064768 RepID=UPI001F3EB5C7|nr:aspartate aminotransferase family protein [Pradoshia eiseniae]
MKDYVFHRDLTKTYPIITHGKGVYLYGEDGKRYLDGCSGAVAANLGHGDKRIAEAMALQAEKAAFVHTMRFETPVLHKLAEKIGKLAPGSLNRVYFTCGGSEANESAIKLSRQYFRNRGEPEKQVVIGRWLSYHGNTIGSLSAGGDIKRRQPYNGYLLPFQHVSAPHCLHCPFNREESDCETKKDWSCVAELERLILEIGPSQVSAFIAEPFTGSQAGAVPPPKSYFREVRALCDRYDVLLIIDEVMTGFCRTGAHFAIEHYGVEPDIITFGKGVSGGYSALGGMIVHDKIIDTLLQYGDGKFVHGYTYSGHPVTVAAGLAAMDIYESEHILRNVKGLEGHLFEGLDNLRKKYPFVYDIRGKGLFFGIELASNQDGQPFPPDLRIAERLNEKAMELGAVFYPGNGTVNGYAGDHLIIAPPLIISEREVDELISLLDDALKDLADSLKEGT